MAFCWRSSKTLSVSGRKKGHFVDTICVWKTSRFCDHIRSPNTTKIGDLAGTGENPKWHFW